MTTVPPWIVGPILLVLFFGGGWLIDWCYRNFPNAIELLEWVAKQERRAFRAAARKVRS